MSRVRVKICGNTRREDVECAVQAGADAVGFIIGFPSTPRNLDLEQAYSLMKGLPPFIDRVAVTRQDDPKLLRRIAERLPIDAVQLIGETPYTPEIRRLFRNTRLIKVVHAEPEGLIQSASEASKLYDAVLIDSKIKDTPGGTGQVHDWALSRKVADTVRPTPIILAGGLNSFNVEDAVKTVKPYAVDVSSGVESAPGVKDHSEVKRFVENAKRVRL
ncbi:MAG: phosphoribosylanthranilate isomerase [Nitrososphaerales archaeon]